EQRVRPLQERGLPEAEQVRAVRVLAARLGRCLRSREHVQDDLRLELRCEPPPFPHPSAPPQGLQPPLCTGLNSGAHYNSYKFPVGRSSSACLATGNTPCMP